MNSATRAAIKMIEETQGKDGGSFVNVLRDAWRKDKVTGKTLADLLKSGMTSRAAPSVLVLGCPILATALVHFLEMVEWDLVASAVMGGPENN